jgi:hypothetical protein
MMHALSTSDLINLWEIGLGRQLPQRALLLLQAACPDTSLDELADLPIGERDSKLMALRELTFGQNYAAVTNCPGCKETVELNLTTDDFTVGNSEHAEALNAHNDNGSHFFNAMGFDIRFRIPNSRDVIDGIESADLETVETRRFMLQKCILSLKQDGRVVSMSELPEAVIESIEHQMELADPLSDIRLVIACPTCGHQWQAFFDILTFFWNEIDNWAHHILFEVHLLASVYGWRETDILAMSAQRRQWYLKLIYA